jgi:hypothetical protein
MVPPGVVHGPQSGCAERVILGAATSHHGRPVVEPAHGKRPLVEQRVGVVLRLGIAPGVRDQRAVQGSEHGARGPTGRRHHARLCCDAALRHAGSSLAALQLRRSFP